MISTSSFLRYKPHKDQQGISPYFQHVQIASSEMGHLLSLAIIWVFMVRSNHGLSLQWKLGSQESPCVKVTLPTKGVSCRTAQVLAASFLNQPSPGTGPLTETKLLVALDLRSPSAVWRNGNSSQLSGIKKRCRMPFSWPSNYFNNKDSSFTFTFVTHETQHT